MAEARKRLEVNVMEGLSIQKEPYEQQIMAMLTQGQAGLQAGVEGEERGAAATAGRTYMGQLAGQERVRTAMGQELQDIELAKIKEEARLADLGMGLDLQEAAGAQQAAADAEKMRAAAIQQGFEGLVQAGSAIASAAPLYSGKTAPTGAPDVLTPKQATGVQSSVVPLEQRGLMTGPPVITQSGQLAPPRSMSVLQASPFAPQASPTLQQPMDYSQLNPYAQIFSSFGGTLPTP